LRKGLKGWLDSLNPDDARQHQAFELPAYQWEDGGWIIHFDALAKPPEHRGDPEIRPVGMLADGQGDETGDQAALLAALKSKASRYGDLQLPYVIAVLETGRLAAIRSEWHRQGALYGSTRVTWRGDGSAQATQASDGFWVGPKGPRHRRVSGVLLAASLRPWNVLDVVPELWLNPFAQRPLHELPVFFPLKVMEVQGRQGHLVTKPAGTRIDSEVLQ
jgi:hypothetical protein